MQVMTPMNPFFASKFFPASLTLAEEEGLAWCRFFSTTITITITITIITIHHCSPPLHHLLATFDTKIIFTIILIAG